MNPIEIAFDYHERTKHHFHRHAASLGYLDWANQPDPFRRYDGAPLDQLLLSGESPSPHYDELFRHGAISPQPINLATISALFEFSLALSAWKEYQGSRWALRINPSSGNLHPTEGYLVAGPIEGLHDSPAVYHYAPKEHALEQRGVCHCPVNGADTVCHCSVSSEGGIDNGFLVGLSSIHWREAWKYGERAFRYCQHDAGHALVAVSFAAARLGWRARLLDIDDASISAIIGLDRDADFTAAEHEHPDMLLQIEPKRSEPMARSLGQVPFSGTEELFRNSAWTGRANSLSKEHVDWPIIDQVSHACLRTSANKLDHSCPSFSPPIESARNPVSAAQIIRQRRSAVAFDAKTPISADQLFLMLDRTLPRIDRPPWDAFPPPICVHLALFVHLVEGLQKGLYMFVRDPRKLDELKSACDPTFAWSKPDRCPDRFPLYQLKLGDARRVAMQLSCHQEIAGASAFSLGMIAEFESPMKQHGPWFYRRLFWETGAIGQVLYLEAEAAGVRATGIGCFFDDPVHDLLGFKDRRFQSLYHFTVGGPIDDPRLTTRPPYA